MKHSKSLALRIPSLLALLLQSCTTVADPFTNGSFELPGGLPPGGYRGYAPGEAGIAGWTVSGVGGAVFLFNGVPTGTSLDVSPVDGAYQIGFNANNGLFGSSMWQSFDTVVGDTYEVTYSVGRWGTGVGTLSLAVVVKSDNGEPLETRAAIPPDHGYQRQVLRFVATSPRSILEFLDTSTATDSVDVLLDAVAVVSLHARTTIDVSEVTVCWESRSNLTYQLQYRSELTTNLWVNLGVPVEGTGDQICVRDPVLAQPRRFYQVLTLP